MGEEVFRPTTVFRYFPQDYYAPPASAGLFGPEFGIMDATTSLKRANFVNTMTFGGGIQPSGTDTPNGTSINFTELQQLAPNADESRRPPQPPADARHDVGRHAELHHRRRQRRHAVDGHAETRAPGALSGRDVVAVPGAEVNAMSQNRRDFLVRSTCAALGAAAFQGTVKQFGLANLLAATA